MDVSAKKAELRRTMQARPKATAHESATAADALLDWLRGTQARRVLLYSSMPGEVSLDSVVDCAPPEFRFFLTRTPASGPLTIHEWDARLERHRFGYLQPTSDSAPVDPTTIDVAVVPGLGFDLRGGRLGWGKGYYDQLLPELTRADVLMGVTLTRLLVDRIPTEPHDVAMTHLLTESGVRLVAP